MLKNYLKIAWRNLLKNKFLTAINIFGLSTGIAFALLISGYVWAELRVNKQLKNPGRQYVLQSKWKDPNMGLENTTVGALAKALKEQYPNLVANYFRWDGIGSNVSKGDKKFRESLQLGDSTMLSMYGFKLIHGNAKTALNAPYTVVISTDLALKYFGKTDVLGKTLSIESFSGTRHDFSITGVMNPPGRNSVTYFGGENNQIFIPASSSSFFGRNMDVWFNIYILSYIELQTGVSPKDLEKPVAQLIKQNAPDQIRKNLKVELAPLADYYSGNGSVQKMLQTLSYIAFFILLMAVINFVNITISRSASRMKEIGLRKVMGGVRRQIMHQFLSESLMLVSISTLLSLVFYTFFRPFISGLLGTDIPALSSYPLSYILVPFLIAFIVGVLAGIYPAFLLSSLKSVDSLKGILKTAKENILLRKALVGFQFCVALIVFIGALIVASQVKLFLNSDLGYNKDFIVSAQVPRDWSKKGVEHMETIRREFAAMPEIENATLSYQIPNGNYERKINIYRASSDADRAITSIRLGADENYAETYSMPLVAGSFLSGSKSEYDLSKIVINETLAKALGWHKVEKAIGQQVRMEEDSPVFTIAGVVKDFHFESMQQHMQPIAFQHINKTQTFRFLSFKIKSNNTAEAIAAIQKKWSELLPGAAFEFSFMDDTLKTMYTTEIQLKKAAYTATVLTIIIVLLGVLSLISLSIQKRIKEIGIRKVLGASVSSIVSLFIKEFSGVILIAGMVACPVAYLIMHNWLNGYVYRISLTGQPFLIALAALASATAILIVLQTIKAALANPVKGLRTE